MEHQDWKPIIFGGNKNTPAHLQEKITISKSNFNGVNSAKIERDEEEGKKLKTYGTEYGRKVQDARKERNLTQKQLAQQLSVKPEVIQNVENGKGLVDGKICDNLFRILKVKRN